LDTKAIGEKLKTLPATERLALILTLMEGLERVELREVNADCTRRLNEIRKEAAALFTVGDIVEYDSPARKRLVIGRIIRIGSRDARLTELNAGLVEVGGRPINVSPTLLRKHAVAAPMSEPEVELEPMPVEIAEQVSVASVPSTTSAGSW
jgi:hypothetical protein